ncbi:Zinc-finger homeodomain protein 2 [Nymphaea thermarum]|nr:Zinc-finger homeodomain protein 2 [Nymphaea thermarum]
MGKPSPLETYPLAGRCPVVVKLPFSFQPISSAIIAPAVMEFDEHEGEVTLPPPVSVSGSNERSRAKMVVPSAGDSTASRKPRYRECLKNHAVGIGGHAVDGCGEFMPGGEDGTLDALKCAACNCHRNFHRREGDSDHFPQFAAPYYRPAAPPGGGYLHIGGGGGNRVGPHPLASQPLQNHLYHHYPQPQALALPHRDDRELQEMTDHHGDTGSGRDGDGGGGATKKRSRTKFTLEQKERMQEFAEKLGWRIQKHDEEAVQQFCREMCVERHVLKVWMHNNKHTLGKKPDMLREEETNQ